MIVAGLLAAHAPDVACYLLVLSSPASCLTQATTKQSLPKHAIMCALEIGVRVEVTGDNSKCHASTREMVSGVARREKRPFSAPVNDEMFASLKEEIDQNFWSMAVINWHLMFVYD